MLGRTFPAGYCCYWLWIIGLLSEYRTSFSFLVVAGTSTSASASLPSLATTTTLSMSDSVDNKGGKDSDDSETVTLTSICACKKCAIEISIPQKVSAENIIATDCHCPACRKFHVAAFGCYLHVPAEQVNLGKTDALTSYSETCDELGPVERLFCSSCFSKMATRPKPLEGEGINNNREMILVNMGGLVDETIPKDYQRAWQKQRRVWQQHSQAAWLKARPPINKTARPLGMPPVRKQITKGGCACGKCQYETKHRPVELQHCYCQLCRQFCGSAFMTWIPVYNEDFQWTTSPPPPLVRTTHHGQRHFCTDCGSALTIVYDDQPDMTWPAAGSLDDATIPATRDEFNYCLDRTCHICMKWRQTWYQVPNDGCERIQYAG